MSNLTQVNGKTQVNAATTANKAANVKGSKIVKTTKAVKVKLPMYQTAFANNQSAIRKAIKDLQGTDLKLTLLASKKVFSQSLVNVTFQKQEELTRCKSAVNKLLKNDALLLEFSEIVRKTKGGKYFEFGTEQAISAIIKAMKGSKFADSDYIAAIAKVKARKAKVKGAKKAVKA